MQEESKTDQGALKVDSREKLEDGRLRIIYRGDFGANNFANVLRAAQEAKGEETGLAV